MHPIQHRTCALHASAPEHPPTPVHCARPYQSLLTRPPPSINNPGLQAADRDLVPTHVAPSYTHHPRNGDTYSAYNKPVAIIDW